MVDLVQKMLALGANPNIKDIVSNYSSIFTVSGAYITHTFSLLKNGQTPLMVAVEAGHLHVVKVFLTESTPQCDLDVQDKVAKI